jgi:nucleoside-diphosphate-sugar epimerase
MKKVLVLGGTRFFGKRLVQRLIDRGDSVTIATRGTTPDPFGSAVTRMQIDRGNLDTLQSAIGRSRWDVVVDQICYSPDDASIACEAFRGRVDRYIHTSTQSIYSNHGEQRESDFIPSTYPIRMGARADFDYAEGKRLAEAVLFQKATFPVVAVRIPIVLGTDDYTGRVKFHVDRVRSGQPIVIPSMTAQRTFIQSGEAARFLEWMIEKDFTGPINACSDGRVSLSEIIPWVERAVGRPAEILDKGRDEDSTPIMDENSACLDNQKAKTLGFQFDTVTDWMPKLITELS